MSRNFESEYKEYLENIKPDLWNKIALQLPDRSEIQNEQEDKVVQFSKHEKKVPFVSKKKKYTRIAGVVAACFCVGILLPFYINHRQDMIHDSQANAYESQPGFIISESVTDINRVVEHKDNAMNFAHAEVQVVAVTDEYVKIVVISSQDENLKTDSEFIVTKKTDVELLEGEKYTVELSSDEEGNYNIESSLLLR